MSETDVKDAVRERYSQAARRVSEGRIVLRRRCGACRVKPHHFQSLRCV